MKVPVKGVIGPWTHAWPDNGLPGPNYEWRYEAVRWWDYWLKDRNTGVLEDPRFVVFIREGHGPDADLQMTPGHWVCVDWPIPEMEWKSYFPDKDNHLLLKPGSTGELDLLYVPSYGLATGLWWGEPTGDMRPDDAGSLVFDSPVVEEAFEVVGFPRVKLRVSADAPLAHWIARLEDVQPDGTVSLVAGALINGSQRDSRLEPKPLVPGEVYDIAFELHFTTWTFKPGHRVRLAVSNALFPMIWPTPYPMTTKLVVGGEFTQLEIPILPPGKRRAPDFKLPEPREQRPDARYLEVESWPHGFYEQKKDLWTSNFSVEWKGIKDYEIQGRKYFTYERDYHETNDLNPAESSYQGEAGARIELEDRTLELHTMIDLKSNEKTFHVIFVREIYENGTLVRRREWKEDIPRKFQ